MTMNSLKKCALGVVGALCLMAPAARAASAADFCMAYFRVGPNEDEIITGKGFKIPPRGRCKPFMGFLKTQFGGPSHDVTGSACTASNGSRVRFVLTTSYPSKGASSTSTIQATLPLPLGPSGMLYRIFTGANSGLPLDESVRSQPCSPAIQPVP